MDLHSFTNCLKEILKHPLPGEPAQFLMATEYHRERKADLTTLSGHKKSAVCLLFYEKEKQINFLLIKRPDTHTHHAGQIALPGGSCEPDESYEHAALRELKEETGISVPENNILGRLSPLYVPVSNFYIQPVVAFTDSKISFLKNKEVEQCLEFPLIEILNETIVGETEVQTAGNLKLKAPYFNVQGFVLWGATAMVLSEFKQLMKKNRVTFSSLFP